MTGGRQSLVDSTLWTVPCGKYIMTRGGTILCAGSASQTRSVYLRPSLAAIAEGRSGLLGSWNWNTPSSLSSTSSPSSPVTEPLPQSELRSSELATSWTCTEIGRSTLINKEKEQAKKSIQSKLIDQIVCQPTNQLTIYETN